MRPLFGEEDPIFYVQQVDDTTVLVTVIYKCSSALLCIDSLRFKRWTMTSTVLIAKSLVNYGTTASLLLFFISGEISVPKILTVE